MSQLIKDLNQVFEDVQLAEAVDTSALTRSTFYKNVLQKDPKVADALKLQWGFPEFMTYANKALDGVKKKSAQFGKLDQQAVEAIEKLKLLHVKLYPSASGVIQKKSEPHKWDDESTYDTAQKKRGLVSHA
jgi:hypothetical protein